MLSSLETVQSSSHLTGESSEAATAGVVVEAHAGVLQTGLTLIPQGFQILLTLLLSLVQLLYHMPCHLCRLLLTDRGLLY